MVPFRPERSGRGREPHATQAKREGQSQEIVTRDCAGIDIGKDTHDVAMDPDRIRCGRSTPSCGTRRRWRQGCRPAGRRRWRWSRRLVQFNRFCVFTIALCTRFNSTAENKRRSPVFQSRKSGMYPNLRMLGGSRSGANSGGVEEEVSLGSSSGCGTDDMDMVHAAPFVLDQFDFRAFLDAEFSKRLASIPEHLVKRERSSAGPFAYDHLAESETVDPRDPGLDPDFPFAVRHVHFSELCRTMYRNCHDASRTAHVQTRRFKLGLLSSQGSRTVDDTPHVRTGVACNIRAALAYAASRTWGWRPRVAVPESVKAAATKLSRHEPVLNETCADLLEQCGTQGLPARVKRSRDRPSRRTASLGRAPDPGAAAQPFLPWPVIAEPGGRGRRP